MKATELMIGDWVLCPDSSREHIVYVQIDAIEEGYGYSLLVTKQRSNWFVDVSEIQPIPLTDEILENNGFVPKGAYALPGEDIGVKRTGNCWALLCYYGDYTSIPFCHISYLHELQHALKLCGIEKEIEL